VAEDVLQEYFQKLKSSNLNERTGMAQKLSMLALAEMRGTSEVSSRVVRVVNGLNEVLEQDSSGAARAVAAELLGQLGQAMSKLGESRASELVEWVVQALIRALQDGDASVRKQAERALQKIGTPSARAVVPAKPWWKFW